MEITGCRFCLAKEDLAPLFGKLSPAQFTRKQVFLTTGVVILPSDNLPQVACKTCIERIKSAIYLRKISTETQNKLQLIYPKSNLTYEKDSSNNLLYEIDNFTTNDEEMNIFLNKINEKVSKTINTLININISKPDNESHIDNEIIINDNLDNESESSNSDNNDNQIAFDHNYHRKSITLPVTKVTSDSITKYAEKESNTQKKMKTKNREVLNSSKKDDHLIKKQKLISRLNKMRFNSNPAMLPPRKFKQLFQSFKHVETKKKIHNSTKNNKKGAKNSNKLTENTTKINHAKTRQNNKKKSQCDNKISHPDNKTSQSDNFNVYEDDNKILIETEVWDDNEFKELEIQKYIDKKRHDKFMSLATSPHSINGCLQCKVCHQLYKRQGFVQHAKRHFPPEFACEICGKLFYGNSHLQYHRQRMHGQEKPLACPMCDYRAVLKQDLTGHMRIHTGERPYVCDVCAASFRVRGDIVQHMRTHFGVKKIQCPRCPNKLFRCLSDVAKHNRRIHHDFTYFCHLCPKTYHGYSGRSSIRKHLAKVHGIPRSEQPLKLKYTKIPKPDQVD